MWVFLEECHKKCQVTSREVDTRNIFTQIFQMKMCTSAPTKEKSIHKTTSAQWKKGHANISQRKTVQKIRIFHVSFPHGLWIMEPNYLQLLKTKSMKGKQIESAIPQQIMTIGQLRDIHSTKSLLLPRGDHANFKKSYLISRNSRKSISGSWQLCCLYY